MIHNQSNMNTTFNIFFSFSLIFTTIIIIESWSGFPANFLSNPPTYFDWLDWDPHMAYTFSPAADDGSGRGGAGRGLLHV